MFILSLCVHTHISFTHQRLNVKTQPAFLSMHIQCVEGEFRFHRCFMNCTQTISREASNKFLLWLIDLVLPAPTFRRAELSTIHICAFFLTCLYIDFSINTKIQIQTTFHVDIWNKNHRQADRKKIKFLDLWNVCNVMKIANTNTLTTCCSHAQQSGSVCECTFCRQNPIGVKENQSLTVHHIIWCLCQNI